VYDGDGSISKNTNKAADILLACTASEKFATQLKKMYKTCGFNVKQYYVNKPQTNTLYNIKLCGRQGLYVLSQMYAQTDLFLPRKYVRFIKHARLTQDESMMELAHTIKQRSTCIRWKVGCVITDESRMNITSVGYNGQAKGEPNHCSSIFSGQCGCIHAETNALIKNNNNGTILYCTGMPCEQCAKLIVNAGIKKVFYDETYRYSYALGLFNRSKINCRQLNRIKYQWKLKINDTKIKQ